MKKNREIEKEKRVFTPNLLFCQFCKVKVHAEINSRTGYLTYLLIFLCFLIFPCKIALIMIPFLIYLTREKIYK